MKPGMFSDDVTDVLHECTYMRMYMSEGGGVFGAEHVSDDVSDVPNESVVSTVGPSVTSRVLDVVAWTMQSQT